MPDIALYILIAIVVVGGGLLYARRSATRALPESSTPAAPRAVEQTKQARPIEASHPTSSTPATPATRPTSAADQRDEAVQLPVDKPKLAQRHAKEAEAIAGKRSERERYLAGLKKTRGGFVTKLGRLFRGKPQVDDALKDEIEELLFTADIGTATAAALFEKVSEALDRKQLADQDAVWEVIRSAALAILQVDAAALDFEPPTKPHVMLMVGVNGVGKTTTLGKLAKGHLALGRKVLLVAGDTFRAAAADQLKVWATRVGCDIHTGQEGADPSSVIFDGIRVGIEGEYDIVMCDTAGRLHTRTELMDELAKIRRSAVKAMSKGRDEELEPHDTFLVLDATIGQNAVAQAKLFKQTMDFSGLVLTKLDGTSKGGVILGICDELQVPVRYIGIGEGVDDLREFDAETFVDALLLVDDED